VKKRILRDAKFITLKIAASNDGVFRSEVFAFPN
jgi:hypothetical protein